MIVLKDVLRAFKIKHWVKNFVVFVPLIFSSNFLNLNLDIKSFLTCISFCFCASAVYLMNDLIDVEKDKLHPIKKERPIASGRMTKPAAYCLLFATFVLSIFLAFFVNNLTLVLVLLYFILNILYSFGLKNVGIIDVACIALGFILRILAGCSAIYVSPSALVILMTFFTSLFFSFIKRKLELQLSQKADTRKSLKEMTPEIVNGYILIFASLSIAFYFTYMLDIKTVPKINADYMYITTIPFSLIILRILLLASIAKEDDPIIIFRDNTLKYLVALYFAVLFLVFCVR